MWLLCRCAGSYCNCIKWAETSPEFAPKMLSKLSFTTSTTSSITLDQDSGRKNAHRSMRQTDVKQMKELTDNYKSNKYFLNQTSQDRSWKYCSYNCINLFLELVWMTWWRVSQWMLINLHIEVLKKVLGHCGSNQKYITPVIIWLLPKTVVWEVGWTNHVQL